MPIACLGDAQLAGPLSLELTASRSGRNLAANISTLLERTTCPQM